MNKLLFFIGKTIFIITILFIIEIILSKIKGSLDIEKGLVKAIVKGIFLTIVILTYKIINLKKIGISIFDKQAFSKIPKITIICTKDFPEIKQNLSNNKAFSFYKSDKHSIEFYYREPYTVSPFIITLTNTIKKDSEFTYEVSAKSKTSFILFDLGSKLKALTLLNSILDEPKFIK